MADFPLLKLMGDTAYSILDLGLHAKAKPLTLVTTGRLDVVLHEPPPERSRHTIGLPRVVGQRLPSLEQALQNPETVWQKLTLDWYGEGERTLEICTGTALWYRYGSDPLPIRWVLTRDPSGKRPPKALFSTDPTLANHRILRLGSFKISIRYIERNSYSGLDRWYILTPMEKF